MPAAKTLLDALEDKVLIGDGCWEWQASLDGHGYGQIKRDGRMQKAHRVVYELLVGSIDPELQLDHLCHNDDPTCNLVGDCPHRRCVNPKHLEPVTHVVNGRRGRVGTKNRTKTHCPQGHEYTPKNTRQRAHGWRQCITCEQEQGAARYRAKKAGR